jgi:hypothetical protein
VAQTPLGFPVLVVQTMSVPLQPCGWLPARQPPVSWARHFRFRLLPSQMPEQH